MNRNSKRRQLTAVIFVAICSALFIEAPAAGHIDYGAWEEFAVVHEVEGDDAYYPSVIFDPNGFGGGYRKYRMWYSNGNGDLFLVESEDGFKWETPVENTGLEGSPHHVQVLYSEDGFGDQTGVKYKIWYWNTAFGVYGIGAIAHAGSDDGVNWVYYGAISQDDLQMLVTGDGPDWNAGTYGPISVIYQLKAANKGRFPFNYSYVLYYNATNGSNETTGLGYSADGHHWYRYGDGAVLAGGRFSDWDCSDAAYGTVHRDAHGYHYWYSGGGGDDGEGGCRPGRVHEGIGYAYSVDGIEWERYDANPIFHIDDGVDYRNERVYTPSVVKDEEGSLTMFYSVKAEGGVKKIALARLFPIVGVDIDIRPGLILLPGKYKWWRWIKVAVLSSPDFDAGSRVAVESLTFGHEGDEPSLKGCRKKLRDVNRDGLGDLICFFKRQQTGFQCGDRTGVLRGLTVDGYPLEGADRIRVLPCRRK